MYSNSTYTGICYERIRYERIRYEGVCYEIGQGGLPCIPIPPTWEYVMRRYIL